MPVLLPPACLPLPLLSLSKRTGGGKRRRQAWHGVQKHERHMKARREAVRHGGRESVICLLLYISLKHPKNTLPIKPLLSKTFAIT